MFEDALLESSGRIRTRRGWFSGVATAVNVAAVGVLLVAPLLHPASLPERALNMLLAAPPPPAPPAVAVHRADAPGTQTAVVNPFAVPRRIPTRVHNGDIAASAPVAGELLAQSGANLSGLADSIGTGAPPPTVRAAPQKKPAISSGVMEGLRVSGETPRYPAIAAAARVEGTVVLAASISAVGTIENLRVVSGPPLLRAAAMDAVRTWRYRPYQLNGQAVEVETTVNVVFHLN